MTKIYSDCIRLARDSARARRGRREVCFINCAFHWCHEQRFHAFSKGCAITNANSNTPAAASSSPTAADPTTIAPATASSSSGHKRKVEASDENDSGYESNELFVMNQALTDANMGTSCHLVAKSLMEVLSSGPALFNGSGGLRAGAPVHFSQFFLGVAANNIANRASCCIRVQTTFHSFVLVKYADQVESLEAWAGGGGQSLAYSLEQCLDSPFQPCTSVECVTAMQNLLNPDELTRNIAFARFSRVVAGYYVDAAVQSLSVEIRPLKAPAEFKAAVTAVLDQAANLVEHINESRALKRIATAARALRKLQ